MNAIKRTSPRLALPGAMGPDGPKVPPELYNEAVPQGPNGAKDFFGI